MAFNEQIARASLELNVTINDAQITAAATRAANNFNQQFARVQAQFKTAGLARQTSAIAALSGAFGGLARNLSIVTPRFNTAGQSLRNFGTQGNRTGQILGGISVALAGVGAAALTLTVNFAKAAGAFQELEQSLTAIIENSSTANITTERFINSFRRLAVESGRSSLQLLSTGRQFLALEFSGQRAIEVMTAFTKAASLTGASNEQLRLALNGVSQIASKGAVAMEELRRQIAENLPGAVNLARFFEILGENLDISTAAARKLQEQGLITADEGIKALVQTLNEATEGVDVFALRANTLSGQLGILREIFDQIVQTRFRPFIDAIVPVLKDLTDGFKSGIGPLGDIEEKFEDFAKLLGEAVADALPKIIELIPQLITLFIEFARVAIPIGSTLLDLATSITNALVPALRLAGAAIGFFSNLLGNAITAGAAVAGIVRTIGAGFSQLGRFVGVFGRAANVIGSAASGVGRFAGIIGVIISGLIELNVLLGTLRTIFGTELPAAIEEINVKFQALVDLLPGVRGFISRIGEGFRDLVDQVQKLVGPLQFILDKLGIGDSGKVEKAAKVWFSVSDAIRATAAAAQGELAKNANKFLTGMIDRLTETSEASDKVAKASRSLEQANQGLGNATRALNKLEAERAELLADTGRDLREIVETEEELTRIRFRLRDIGQEEVEIAKELAELRSPASAEDLAEADRDIERTKIALNKAIREEKELLGELNDEQKISVDLSGLTLDQLRTKLAGIRASLALERARSKNNKSDLTVEEQQTLARLDTEEAQQAHNEALEKRTELENTVQNNATKIRELEERLLTLSIDREAALRDEIDAQKELNTLRSGDTSRVREIKALEEQILTAKQSQAEAVQAIRDAEDDVTDAKFEQRRLTVEARGFEAEINALLVERLAFMKLLTKEQALAAATSLVASLPGFALQPGVQGPVSSPASALLLAQEIADALLNNPNALRSILQRLGITGLAKGGMITSPTLAQMGEKFRPELVLPLTRPDRVWNLLSQNLPKFPGALAAAQSAVAPNRAAIKMPTSGVPNRRGDGPMSYDQAEEIIKLLRSGGTGSVTVEAPITVSSPVQDPNYLARKLEQRIARSLEKGTR